MSKRLSLTLHNNVKTLALFLKLLMLVLVGLNSAWMYLIWKSSHATKTHENIHDLAWAAQLYNVDIGHYPITVDELYTNASQVKGWYGPYLVPVAERSRDAAVGPGSEPEIRERMLAAPA